ncbi:hypothetical protein ACWCQZ_46330 [Streptomyces sp. NPDC002285]
MSAAFKKQAEGSEQAVCEEIAQLFPLSASPDLSSDRRQRILEHLMSEIDRNIPASTAHQIRHRSWPRLSHRAGETRRRSVRFATPMALVMAAIGAFVALNPSTTATAGHVPNASSRGYASVPASSSPTRISTVAYTLDHGTGDTVKITLHAGATLTANAAELQKDLAAMGIQARVTRGGPHTVPALDTLAQHDKNGDFVATLPRKVVSKFPTTIFFSLKPGAADALTITVGTN